MSEQTDLQLALSIEADNSVDAAIKKLDSVAKAEQNIAKGAANVGAALDKAFKALPFDDVISDAAKAEKAIDRVADSADHLAAASAKVKSTKGFELAGQAESGIRALGGAVGAAGFGEVGSAIGAAGELPGLIEALPKLKDAIGGLPEIVSAAATALGPGGILAAGILAGVALIFAEIQKQAEQTRHRLEQEFQVIRDVETAIASGVTTERAEATLQQIEIDREAALAAKERLIVERDALQVEADRTQALRDVTGAFGLGGGALSLGDQNLVKLQEYNSEIKELDTTIDDSQIAVDEWTNAIANGEFAANSAAEAERTLAQERTAAILDEAAAAGELASVRARATSLTQEQIDSELQALSLREAGLKAELASLKASGDTSEVVADKISGLNAQLKNLGDQAGVLRGARGTARSSVADKAAEDAAREAEREAERREKSLLSVARKGTSASVSEAENREKELADINRQFAEDEARQRQELIDKRLDEQINFAREIEDILRDSKRDRGQALREGDFLGLSEINRQEKEAREDAIISNRRDNQDITREAERQHRDLVVAAENQRRDITAVTQNMHQNVLGMTRNFAQTTLGIYANFFSALQRNAQARTGAGMFRSAPATPG